MRFRYLSVLLLLASLAASIGNASALERILSFHSNIVVHQNGDMTVNETITVQAEGQKIRRGIYRDFPTTYKDHLGNRYRVGFQLLSVKRDGQPENYHTKNLSNGIRIYFGNKNRTLKKGKYRYTLSYRTNRQLGFFADHDELYWNVTGNDWDFQIDSASASVQLPSSVKLKDIGIEGYTGRFGSKGQDYHTRITEDRHAQIMSSRALRPGEGLTLVTLWPKGHVHEPTKKERLEYLIQDNGHLFYIGGGMVLLLIYYLIVWTRIGRDQPAGVIIPLYYPPKGYSPASMRFIEKRGYDHKTFATALVNLAVKGAIFLDEKDDVYTVRKNDEAPRVAKSAGENVLLNKLLGHRNSLKLEQENHSRISKAIDAHKASLKRDYEKIYFVRNSGWLFPGLLISVVTIVLGLLNSPTKEGPPAIFLIIWLSIWSTVVYFLFLRAFRQWRKPRSVGGYASAIGATFFASVFGFFEVMAIFAFTQIAPFSLIASILLLIGINIVFYHLLHADTRAGRKLVDKAEGFRQYLDVAEGDELKVSGGPNMTTDLFEMYLPYALALDVEQRWVERFAEVFANLEREGTSYHPGWYHGSHWHYHNLGGFTDSIGGSLSSAISSSSTAPGSSSGGGGGGSSGGGGGGGGGGGW